MDGSEPESASHAAEYRRRLQAFEAQMARLDRLAERVSGIRIALAIVGVAAVWWSVQSATAPSGVWLVPLTLFVGAVIYHSRVRRARTRTDRAAAHYRLGLARIEDRWSGLGLPGTDYDDPHHVYAADLDLFGHGNLFELLSIARTRMGERTLASWLLSAAPTTTIVQRQQSIAELRDRLDFREDLAVLGETAEVGVRPDELVRWGESANQLTQRWIVPAATAASNPKSPSSCSASAPSPSTAWPSPNAPTANPSPASTPPSTSPTAPASKQEL